MAETKKTILKRIDRNLLALLSLFPATLRLRFGTPETRDDLPRGTPQMNTLKDTQKVTVTLEEIDAAGNRVPADFTATPVWQSSDPTIVTVSPATDGVSADVATTGKLGTAQVRVDGTTASGRQITGIGDIEVVTSEATTISLKFGTPVDK